MQSLCHKSPFVEMNLKVSGLLDFLLIKIKPQHHAGEFGLIGIGSQAVAEGFDGLLSINTALSVLLKPTIQRQNAQAIPGRGAIGIQRRGLFIRCLTGLVIAQLEGAPSNPLIYLGTWGSPA